MTEEQLKIDIKETLKKSRETKLDTLDESDCPRKRFNDLQDDEKKKRYGHYIIVTTMILLIILMGAIAVKLGGCQY
jgi:hypothetical protein